MGVKIGDEIYSHLVAELKPQRLSQLVTSLSHANYDGSEGADKIMGSLSDIRKGIMSRTV